MHDEDNDGRFPDESPVEVLVITSHQCTHVERHPAVIAFTSSAAGLDGQCAYAKARIACAHQQLGPLFVSTPPRVVARRAGSGVALPLA